MRAILALGFVSLLGLLQALPVNAEQPQPSMTRPQTGFAWLGVVVSSLSDDLRTQLSSLLPMQEGVLVDRVEQDSPAARAGIQRFDVLVSFGGQKLYSPSQLSNLVKYSNPASEVEINVIRQGQPTSLTITLAMRQPRLLGHTKRPPYAMPPRPRQPPTIAEPYSIWDRFESLEVQALADGRFRASVSYQDQDNQAISLTFEGDRQEILQQIMQEQKLPVDKKRALLRALGFRPDRAPGLRDFGYLDEYFRSPRWSQDPFDQPFFTDPYYLDRYDFGPWRSPPWQLHVYPDPPDQKRP